MHDLNNVIRYDSFHPDSKWLRNESDLHPFSYWVQNYGENNIVDFNDVEPPGVVRTDTGNFRITLNDGRVADVHPWLWCDDGRKLYGVRYWID